MRTSRGTTGRAWWLLVAAVAPGCMSGTAPEEPAGVPAIHTSAPSYTLDMLEGVLTQGGARPEGLVLTLKLTEPSLAEKLPAIADGLRRFGFRRVRLRQLAFNRREVCAVASDPT